MSVGTTVLRVVHDPRRLSQHVFWLLVVGFVVEACKLVFSR